MKWRFIFSEDFIKEKVEPPQVFKTKFAYRTFEELWEDNIELMIKGDLCGFYGIHLMKLIESITGMDEEVIVDLIRNDNIEQLKVQLQEAFEKQASRIIA